MIAEQAIHRRRPSSIPNLWSHSIQINVAGSIWQTKQIEHQQFPSSALVSLPTHRQESGPPSRVTPNRTICPRYPQQISLDLLPPTRRLQQTSLIHEGLTLPASLVWVPSSTLRDPPPKNKNVNLYFSIGLRSSLWTKLTVRNIHSMLTLSLPKHYLTTAMPSNQQGPNFRLMIELLSAWHPRVTDMVWDMHLRPGTSGDGISTVLSDCKWREKIPIDTPHTQDQIRTSRNVSGTFRLQIQVSFSLFSKHEKQVEHIRNSQLQPT